MGIRIAITAMTSRDVTSRSAREILCDAGQVLDASSPPGSAMETTTVATIRTRSIAVLCILLSLLTTVLGEGSVREGM